MAVAEKELLSTIESVVLQGDLSKLTQDERIGYYRDVCRSLGLNPLTKPFDYIKLDGKLTLYARKDATEQLRTIKGISISKIETKIESDVYIVIAHAIDKEGRTDVSTGAVSLVRPDGSWVNSQDKYGNPKKIFKKSGTFTRLSDDDLANAIMKAETKAKRRVTLSIAGLGMLDETEVSSIQGAKVLLDEDLTGVNLLTGEIDCSSDNKLLSEELMELFKKGRISQEKISRWLWTKGADCLENVQKKHLVEGIQQMKVKLKEKSNEI